MTVENVGMMPNGEGNLETKDTEVGAVLGAFSTLVSTDMISLQEPQVPDASGKVWSKKGLPQWNRTGLRNA